MSNQYDSQSSQKGIKHKNPKKYSKWNDEQLKKYIDFLIANRTKIDCRVIPSQVIKQMKSQIDTQKSVQACKKQHESFRKKFISFDGIILGLKNKIRAKIDDHEWQIDVENKLKHYRQKELVRKEQLFCSIVDQMTFEEQAFNLILSNLNTDRLRVRQTDRQAEWSPYVYDKDQNQYARQFKTGMFFLKPKVLETQKDQKLEISQNQSQNNQISESQAQSSQQDDKKQHVTEVKQFQNTESWNKEQKLRFLVFMLKYQSNFEFRKQILSMNYKYTWNIFTKMAQFIENKKIIQCKRYYQSIIGRANSIKAGIEKLIKKQASDPEQIQTQINRIQNYYNNHLRQQLNAVYSNKSMTVEISSQNRQKIKSILQLKYDQWLIKQRPHQVSEVSNQGSDSILLENTEKYLGKGQNQSLFCFEVQIPILLSINYNHEKAETLNKGVNKTLVKDKIQQKQKNSAFKPYSDQNKNKIHSKQKDIQRLKYPHQQICNDIFYGEDNSHDVSYDISNDDSHDNENDEVQNRINLENAQCNNNTEYNIHRESEVKNKFMQKNEEEILVQPKERPRIGHLWTVSEKIKFLISIQKNKSIFYSGTTMISQNYFSQIAEIIGTGKTLRQCRDRLSHCKHKSKGKVHEMIQSQSLRYRIRFDLLQLRQQIQTLPSYAYQNLKTFRLHVEYFPSLFFINRQNFNSNKVIKTIEETDLSLNIVAELFQGKEFLNDHIRQKLDQTKEKDKNDCLAKVTITFESLPKKFSEELQFKNITFFLKQKLKFYVK